jgi:ribosomal protein L44E
MICGICSLSIDDLTLFSRHIRSEHKLSSEEYTIKYIHGGVKPHCVLCNNETRYVSFTYKKYCKEHAKVAMSESGVIGGKAEAWNKGNTKETDERIAKQALAMSGVGNPFYGKKHTDETIRKIQESKTVTFDELMRRINARQSEFTLVSNPNDYYSRQKQYLTFKCNSCGYEQPKTLQAFERGSKCDSCFPVGSSQWEWEVGQYVESLGFTIDRMCRDAIHPKEIDIYVPSVKFGIECHGLYWHSEGSPRFTNKNVHYEKADIASQLNVRLLQFFYDEWRDKRPICESLIRSRLNVSISKVGARQCNVIMLDSKVQKKFFDETHISGYVPSTVCYALERNSEIIAALSLRIPRQKKYDGMMEVARYSVRLNTNCQGALGKLFNEAEKYVAKNSHKGIMTYVDRRIGDGHGYIAIGMQLDGKTAPDYWYTDNFLRYDRFAYRAQGDISEKEVTMKAGVSRIWGAGSLILSKEITPTS